MYKQGNLSCCHCTNQPRRAGPTRPHTHIHTHKHREVAADHRVGRCALSITRSAGCSVRETTCRCGLRIASIRRLQSHFDMDSPANQHVSGLATFDCHRPGPMPVAIFSPIRPCVNGNNKLQHRQDLRRTRRTTAIIASFKPPEYRHPNFHLHGMAKASKVTHSFVQGYLSV